MTRVWLFGSLAYLALALLTVLAPAPITAYYEFTTLAPPASMASMPTLHIGSTFSLTGSYAASFGLPNGEALMWLANETNARGGVLVKGVKTSITLSYVNDWSAPDLINYYYTILAQNVKSGLNSTANKLPHIDVLFTPHGSSVTAPAVAPVKAANISVWTTTASAAAQFNSAPYPYIWGGLGLGDVRNQKPIELILSLRPAVKSVAYFIRMSDAYVQQSQQVIRAAMNASGISEAFVHIIDPSTVAGDPSMQAYFLKQLLLPEFPQSVDVLCILSLPIDQYQLALALAQSKRTPGIAITSQYYDDTLANLPNQEGWVGTFTYHPTVTQAATLPGVVFKDTDDFTNSFMKYYSGRIPTPIHAQDAAAWDGMMSCLYSAASFSAPDLRTANLALNGSTFLYDLRYNKLTGANTAQQSILMQVQSATTTHINDFSKVVYPVEWPWTIPIVYTQSAAQKALMILGFIALFFLAVVMIGFFLSRHGRVMHAASPVMMAILLCGCACMIIAGILEVQTPSANKCNSALWLFNIGFTLSLGSLLLKTYRLMAIFYSKQLVVAGWTDVRLIKLMGVILLWELILLAIRTGVAPYTDSPLIQQCELADDLESSKSKLADALLILLIIDKAIMLAYAAYLVFKVRKLPSLYNESTYLAGVIYNCGVICLLWIALRYSFDFTSVNSRAQTLTVIEAAAMYVAVIITLIAIFAPKFYTIMKSDQSLIKVKGRVKGGGGKRGSTGGAGGVGPAGPANSKPLQSVVDSAISGVPAQGGSVSGGTVSQTSATTEATLAAVRAGIQTSLDTLDAKILQLEKEFGSFTRKAGERKAEIALTHQQLAQMHAEMNYLDAMGTQLTREQLAQMLDQHSTNSGASSGVAPGGNNSRGNNSGLRPPPIATGASTIHASPRSTAAPSIAKLAHVRTGSFDVARGSFNGGVNASEITVAMVPLTAGSLQSGVSRMTKKSSAPAPTTPGGEIATPSIQEGASSAAAAAALQPLTPITPHARPPLPVKLSAKRHQQNQPTVSAIEVDAPQEAHTPAPAVSPTPSDSDTLEGVANSNDINDSSQLGPSASETE